MRKDWPVNGSPWVIRTVIHGQEILRLHLHSSLTTSVTPGCREVNAGAAPLEGRARMSEELPTRALARTGRRGTGASRPEEGSPAVPEARDTQPSLCCSAGTLLRPPFSWPAEAAGDRSRP